MTPECLSLSAKKCHPKKMLFVAKRRSFGESELLAAIEPRANKQEVVEAEKRSL